MKTISFKRHFKILLCTIIALIIQSPTKTSAQCIQKGKVVQYNGRESKTALGGVEILAINAGSTVSDTKGAFTLNFNRLRAGDKIKISHITKNGYIVFNKEAVDQWHISRTGATFSIVMCKEEKYREIRNNYERVSSESYDRQMKAEEQLILKLRKQNKITEEKCKQQIKTLHEKYETRLENLDTYIDRVARIDLSEITDKENEIVNLMQQGKVDEALKAYESMNLEAKLDKEIKTGKGARD